MSLKFDETLESGKRLQATLDACRIVGFWEWDHVRHVATYDRGAARYLAGNPDLAEQELVAEAAMAAIHRDDVAWLREQMVRAVCGTGPSLAEYRVVLRDGEVRWVLSRSNTERRADGTPLRTRGILIDITEDREAGDGYVIEARSARGSPLEQAADHAMALRRLLGQHSSPTLTLIADMLLLQIGREIAQGPNRNDRPLH